MATVTWGRSPSSAWRALAQLPRRSVTFSAHEGPRLGRDGWAVDHYCQPLPSEAPGPPVPGGSWAIARAVIRDYEFADPRLTEAHYRSDEPLVGRDMLLVGRFYGLRFHMGVRVSGVVDDELLVDGRPARVWGWHYDTLEGHLEAGRMGFEAWKWTDTGEVEFRMRRTVRPGRIRNPIVRLGLWVFGRWMQERFVRRACDRMVEIVRIAQRISRQDP